MLERIATEIYKEIDPENKAGVTSTEWLQQTRLYKRLKGRLRSMIAKGENPGEQTESEKDSTLGIWSSSAADVLSPRTWQQAIQTAQAPQAAGGFVRGPARIQFTPPEPTIPDPPAYEGEINFTLNEPDGLPDNNE